MPLAFNTIPRIKRATSPQPTDGLRGEMKELFYGKDGAPGSSFKVMVLRVDKTQRAYNFSELKRETNDISIKGGSIWPQFTQFISTIKAKYVGKEELSDIGQFDFNTTLFFFEHDVELSEEDSIIEVETNNLGEPVDPIKYIEKYSIKDIELLRQHNGRVEFKKVYASKSE